MIRFWMTRYLDVAALDPLNDPKSTVTINTVSSSGSGHVVIFERSARAVVARAPKEILDPSDFRANTKSMGKWCVFICFSSYTLSLGIFSKILPNSCVELIIVL